MSWIRFIIAALFIATGVFFSCMSVLGVFRFKYVLTRMHSAAMGDSLSILCVLVGLIILSGFTFTSLKLAVIIIFFWLTGPVSSHLITNLVGEVDKENVMKICEPIEADEQKNL